MAAITSSEPPRTRLSSRDGSYSQMAVAFSTTAIFVIFFMTSTFPRLTTWPKQLAKNIQKGKTEARNKCMHGNCCSFLCHFGNPRRL